MVYGFKRGCYDKGSLDKMSQGDRIALAKQNAKKGTSMIFPDNVGLSADSVTQLYWVYDEPDCGASPRKVFVVVFASYDDEGLYTETNVFDTLEKAVLDKETYIRSELSNEDSHFGGILQDVCDGNLDEFNATFARQMTERSYRIADTRFGDYFINIDIHEEIVR